MNIAILEDDLDQANLLAAWLQADEQTPDIYTTAESFKNGYVNHDYDLVILDWVLPESSGLDVLRWVRDTSEWNIPVLFLTQRDDESSIVKALEEGADDFLAKPVSRAITVARVRALGRRSTGGQNAANRVLEIDEFIINKAETTLYRNNEVIPMTEREFKLAVLFFSNIGRLLSRDFLLSNVWKVQQNLATRTVDTHISRVRQKLQLVPENNWQLKAIYQHGYRLERLTKTDSE